MRWFSVFKVSLTIIVAGGALLPFSAKAADYNLDGSAALPITGYFGNQTYLNGADTVNNTVIPVAGFDPQEGGAPIPSFPANYTLTEGGGPLDTIFSGTIYDTSYGGGYDAVVPVVLVHTNGYATFNGHNLFNGLDSGYTGGTIIQGGGLTAGTNGAFGTGTITISGTSVLGYLDGITLGNDVSIGTSGFQLEVALGTSTATQSGVISETGGARAVEKIGAGKLILSNANTYTGGTTISGGTLTAGHATSGAIDALGTGNITINNAKLTSNITGTLSNRILINSGSSATIGAASGQTLTLSGDDFTYNGGAETVLHFGTSADTGTVVLSPPTGVVLNSSGTASVDYGTLKLGTSSAATLIGNLSNLTVNGTFDINGFEAQGGNLSGSGTITNGGGAARDFTVASSADSTFSGVIQDGVSEIALVKQGTGTLTLSGNNNNFGATTVSGGTLKAGSTGAFGFWSVMHVADGATLDLNGFSTHSFGLDGDGTVTNTGSSDATYSVGENSSDPSTVDSFSGVLQDGSTNKLALTLYGSGTQVLSGTNTYSGETVVYYGTLKAGAVNTFSPNSLLYVVGGGLAGRVDLNGHNQTVAALAGEVGGIVINNGGSAATLTINGGQSANFYSFLEDGSSPIALVVTGTSSSLQLLAANTYSGGTTVTGNSYLYVSNNNALGLGSVTLNAGTLSFNANRNIANDVVLTGSGGILSNDVGVHATLSGTISGAGTLFVNSNSTGVVALSHANTYQGGTVVNGGILSIGNDNNLGNLSGNLSLDSGTLQTTADVTSARTVNVQSGGSTIDTNGHTDIFTGNFVGVGDLTKIGTGLLVLDGAGNTFNSATVNAGNLQIGDATHTSAAYTGDIAVSASGTLSGHGTITGNINNHGHVAPGGSIGTTTVLGNYTQNSVGVLSIEATPTASSVLSVSGVATLGGTVAVTFDAGTYTVGHVYDFMNAGSFSGAFSSITGTTPDGYILSDVTYTGTVASFSLISPGPGAGGAIFGGGTSAMSMDTAFGSVENIFDGANQNNSNALSSQNSFTDSFVDSQVVGGSAAIRNVVSNLSQTAKDVGGWFKASGKFGAVDSSGSATGFAYNSGGFMTGIDRMVTDDVAMGVAFGYDHSSVSAFSDDPASADADTRRLFLYGKTKQGDVNVIGALGYGYSSVHTTRYVRFNASTGTADHVEQTVSLAAQASQTFSVNGLTITPRAGFAYTRLMADGYNETGAGAFNLKVGAKVVDSIRPFVGAGISEDFEIGDGQTLTPSMHIRYTHELIAPDYSASIVSSGISSTITGNNPTRDVVTTGFGIGARLTNDLQFYGNYDLTIPTGNNIDHSFNVGVKMSF